MMGLYPALAGVFEGPRGSMRFHAGAAVFWAAVGVFGVVQFALYLRTHHIEHAFSPIAMSIPVLFFISVYANVVGHWSSYQAARSEWQSRSEED